MTRSVSLVVRRHAHSTYRKRIHQGVKPACPASWNRSLTFVCMCVHGLAQATDWQQQWCIEFALAWVLLGTLLRSSTSCATLSNALLRARASVTRGWSAACDGPLLVRCLR